MSDTYPHSENRPLTAFVIVIGTVFLFASGDILIKYLTTRYPVELIMAIRSVVGLLLILAFFWPRMGRTLWQIKRPRLVLCRGLVLVLGSLLIGHALRLMPVGETISILYSFPILVMILAIPLMGEQVSAIDWGFAVLGFIGVLMVARPGGVLDRLSNAYPHQYTLRNLPFWMMRNSHSRPKLKTDYEFDFCTLTSSS